MAPTYSTRWSTRRFTSFTLLLSFLASLFTGIVCYLAPRGRVANWTGWNILGLGKEDWAAVHTTTSVLLLLAAGLHLWFNWRPLKTYLKGTMKKAKFRKAELALAALLLAATWVGTVRGWQPFVQLARWNDQIKAWWEERSAPAPAPHEEEAPLEKVASDYGLPAAAFLEKLVKAGFHPEGPGEILGHLAAREGLSAAEVIRKALGNGGPSAKGQGRNAGNGSQGAGGSGWGRMTLEEFCNRRAIDLEKALKELKAKGVPARPQDRIRDLAEPLGIRPREMETILKGKK